MYVILLHSGCQHVLATCVAIFSVVKSGRNVLLTTVQ